MGAEYDKAKGKVKQAAGDLTGNSELRREGLADERAGKAKGKVEDAKDKANDAIDAVKDKLSKHSK